jgi:3-oxoacyl-[acyl-carrier protein] reductase/meso-butanediol dehydrogenase/(S,S)-butanediol dehydrogenase/diacetyl reductase
MSRTTIITGGTTGIGAALARVFHQNGDHVLIAARKKGGLAGEAGPRLRFEQADVTQPSAHAALVEAALKWTGRVDTYVNNAGRSQWMPLDLVTEAFWEEMMEVNLKSVLFGSQQAALHMARGSCILNVSSMAGKRGSANNSVYCAAKFGVNGITQALAKELGPRGIRVVAVCPVLVETPGLMQALEDPHSPGKGGARAFLSEFTRQNAALGALPTAEQVADFCYKLVGSTAITGQCINVDCGVFPQ